MHYRLGSKSIQINQERMKINVSELTFQLSFCQVFILFVIFDSWIVEQNLKIWKMSNP